MSARLNAEQPQPPAQHRLESIIALAGVTAVLLFFFASLIERLVREPTGLELLELERQRELVGEPEEPGVADAYAGSSIAPESRLAVLQRLVLQRVAAGVLSLPSFGDGLRSVVLRMAAPRT